MRWLEATCHDGSPGGGTYEGGPKDEDALEHEFPEIYGDPTRGHEGSYDDESYPYEGRRQDWGCNDDSRGDSDDDWSADLQSTALPDDDDGTRMDGADGATNDDAQSGSLTDGADDGGSHNNGLPPTDPMDDPLPLYTDLPPTEADAPAPALDDSAWPTLATSSASAAAPQRRRPPRWAKNTLQQHSDNNNTLLAHLDPNAVGAMRAPKIRRESVDTKSDLHSRQSMKTMRQVSKRTM